MPPVPSNGNGSAAHDLLDSVHARYGTILADPPWRFSNRTGKMAPEHKRLSRYATMTMQEIMELPVAQLAKQKSHLYLWIPNALILEGLEVMRRWGFTYKTNIVWYKIRKDGGPDGRGVGFYFRNVTELVLFGVRGHLRTGPAGRRQTNIMVQRKREHSRKPDQIYDLAQRCSPGPYLELFARHHHEGWTQWGDECPAIPVYRRVRLPQTGALFPVGTPQVLPTKWGQIRNPRGRYPRFLGRPPLRQGGRRRPLVSPAGRRAVRGR